MAGLFPRPVPPPDTTATFTAPRPRPLSSLLASARRLTGADRAREVKPKAEDWQTDAWSMYDLVGEQRFLANTLAGRMAQARFYVGRRSDDPLGDPVPLDPEMEGQEDDQTILDVFDAFGGGAAGRAQMTLRLGINLFVAGDGWIVGVPRDLLPPHLRAVLSDGEPPTMKPPGAPSDRAGARGVPGAMPDDPTSPYLALDDLEWRAMSVSEVTTDAQGDYVVHYGGQKDERVTLDADHIVLIRVWRPHPQKAWQADSPTRSSLPVLRELVGLTMHIGAQVDSRLAGAGLLIVPQSAEDALRASRATPDDDAADDSDEDAFTEALIEAMTTPINDRSSASAVVPLVVTVPDDVTDKFHHMTFANALDEEARELRDESIRRLALGQDAPPELLLGTGGMNHWGAWLVREDVVTTHIEPPLSLICDAWTTQYLWPTLTELGYAEEDAREYVVWYDVSHMIVRPNRSTDAATLYDRGVLSDSTLRASMGFSDDDAPGVDGEEFDPAVALAWELVKSAPALLTTPGLPAIVDQIRAVMGDAPAPPPTDTGADIAVDNAGGGSEVTPDSGGVPATAEGTSVGTTQVPTVVAGGGVGGGRRA